MQNQYMATLAYDRSSSIQRQAEQKFKIEQEKFKTTNQMPASHSGEWGPVDDKLSVLSPKFDLADNKTLA